MLLDCPWLSRHRQTRLHLGHGSWRHRRRHSDHRDSKRAKQELSDLAFNKPVSIRLVDIDRYERIIGRIYVNDLDVSAETAEFAFTRNTFLGIYYKIVISIIISHLPMILDYADHHNNDNLENVSFR